jgi:hypothetical protein
MGLSAPLAVVVGPVVGEAPNCGSYIGRGTVGLRAPPAIMVTSRDRCEAARPGVAVASAVATVGGGRGHKAAKKAGDGLEEGRELGWVWDLRVCSVTERFNPK